MLAVTKSHIYLKETLNGLFGDSSKNLIMFCTLRGVVSGCQAYCQENCDLKGVNKNKLRVDNL